MRQALTYVKRRLHAQRAAKGASIGLLLSAAAALGVLAVSYLVPITVRRELLLAAALLAPLTTLISAVLPFSWMEVAKAADACGLQARAQTALALERINSPMATLQRADAVQALHTLNLRKEMPVRGLRKPLCAAAVFLFLCGLLCFVPNPQDKVLQTWEEFGVTMQEAQALLNDTLSVLDDAQQPEKTTQELRRLLSELVRRLGTARTSQEALTQIADAQRKMERMMQESKHSAIEALRDAGLGDLADALDQGAEALEAALEQKSGEALADALQQAAEQAANAEAAQALQQAAAAFAEGKAAGAAQVLSALEQVGSAHAIASALQTARAIASGQGSLSSSGQDGSTGKGANSGGASQGNGGSGGGQGTGAGAGQGSSQEDSGKNKGAGTAGSAQSAPQYKLGEYESIYDPTRLGDGGEIKQSTGEVGEGEHSVMTLAPGLGDASGYVPYDQVAGEYHEQAVQRAQEAALPAYAREWINAYFTALTEK